MPGKGHLNASIPKHNRKDFAFSSCVTRSPCPSVGVSTSLRLVLILQNVRKSAPGNRTALTKRPMASRRPLRENRIREAPEA